MGAGPPTRLDKDRFRVILAASVRPPPMIAKVKHISGPARQEWSNDRGSVIVELRAPSIVLVTLRGYPDATMGTELAAALDESLESPDVRHLFVQAEEMIGYHSNVRTEPTKVLLKYHERITIHVLARSKLVQMGLAVVNVALQGEVQVYKERGEFLRVLNAALGGR
jgi:hypothetical protein